MKQEKMVRSGQKPLLALLANHHPEEQNLLKEQLAAFGWSLDIVVEASQLQHAAEQGAYSLIVVDSELPGFQLADWISKMKQAAPEGVPIVVTAADDVSSDVHYLNLSELRKPFNSEEIREILQNCMGDSKSLEQFEGYTYQRVVTTRVVGAEEGSRIDILQELQRCNLLDATTANNINLAYQEALANAVEHGNLELPSEWREIIDEGGVDKFSCEKAARLKDERYAKRRIQVSIKIVDSTLLVEVVDQGNGFSIKGPRSTSSSECESLKVHGRGLAIMEQVMDRVEYLDGGRRVVMSMSLKEDDTADGS